MSIYRSEADSQGMQKNKEKERISLKIKKMIKYVCITARTFFGL